MRNRGSVLNMADQKMLKMMKEGRNSHIQLNSEKIAVGNLLNSDVFNLIVDDNDASKLPLSSMSSAAKRDGVHKSNAALNNIWKKEETPNTSHLHDKHSKSNS